MKHKINIQSISDIITNSSSEVFVCSVNGDPSLISDEIQELIDSLIENLGYDNDYGATVYVADEDYTDEWYNYSWKKGDVIIESLGDNSIPFSVMEILSDLKWTPRFDNIITDVQRHHLG